ncbi:MAG: DUF3568 family protein [Phycisphaerales bacterium]
MKTMMAMAMIAGATALGPACTTTRTGSGTVEDYNAITGNLSTTLAAPLDKVYAASVQTMRELEFRQGEEKKDALVGIITAKMADDRVVSVRLDKKTDNLTAVTVGGGMLGSESVARIVLEKIREKVR